MTFFKRHSRNRVTLLSWHPRWSLTWSFILDWDDARNWRTVYGMRTYKYKRGVYGWLQIGRLSFVRQPTMRLK